MSSERTHEEGPGPPPEDNPILYLNDEAVAYKANSTDLFEDQDSMPALESPGVDEQTLTNDTFTFDPEYPTPGQAVHHVYPY